MVSSLLLGKMSLEQANQTFAFHHSLAPVAIVAYNLIQRFWAIFHFQRNIGCFGANSKQKGIFQWELGF